ncbi:MAG: hypothetical protein ACRDQA_30805, partial [Nocardioidaceae bacterium]
DELIERVEQVPSPTTDAAVESIQALSEVYGEALARVMDAADDGLVEKLASDELVRHLLVLHDNHPDSADEHTNHPTSVQEQAEQALDDIRPYIESQAGQGQLDETTTNDGPHR